MPSFEESLELINNEINKRRPKWNLTVLAWMDFEDVAQILRIHIFKKWKMYDKSRPLAPWLNRIISHQIRNIVRNVYSNCCRPCLRCAAAEGEDGCRIYNKQCNSCPLYATWEKSKKRAYDVKLPVSLEVHSQEVFSKADDNMDIERTALNIHEKMKTILKPLEWKVYELLYVNFKSDDEVSKLMGYKTSEEGRLAGYKRLKNIKKTIITKVKKCLVNGDIDIV